MDKDTRVQTMRDNSKSCEIAEAGSLSPSPSLDLIDQMAEEDAKGEDRFAFDEQKFEVKDLVEAVYDGKMANAHSDFCDYRPYVNYAGIIFCLTCGSTVGSVNDNRDAFCLACGCICSGHFGLEGPCLMLFGGKPCPCKSCVRRVT